MAQFLPDADGFDVEDFIEQLSIDLSDRYREVEDTLIREVADRAYRDLRLTAIDPDAVVAGGLTAAERRRQNRLLAELAGRRAQAVREVQALAVAMVDRLNRSGTAEDVVRVAMLQGEAAAAAQLGFASRTPAGPSGVGGRAVGSYAAQATASLAASLQSRLEVLNARITRYPQDAFQRIVSLTSPGTLMGASTGLRQQQETVRRFLREGITGFVDVSGRRWTIGSYSEMAGRTAVNRAFNDATQWRLQQSGINLATIVGGFDACSKCGPWIGKIVSLDGSPSGPRIMRSSTTDQMVTVQVAGSIQDARNAGWNHPNCRCRPVAFSPGLSVPQADYEYNADAERARERQREIERSIRKAKRDAATAPDDVSRKRAEADVRDLQGQMRQFLGQTGRTRSNWREQLHFADGR